MAGGAIYYRTRIQPTIALSSTEAEFAAMTDAGKAAIYLRSILDQIGLTQEHPTEIQVANRGARYLANAQQPTRNTRHIDIKQMIILQWTDEEQSSTKMSRLDITSATPSANQQDVSNSTNTEI